MKITKRISYKTTPQGYCIIIWVKEKEIFRDLNRVVETFFKYEENLDGKKSMIPPPVPTVQQYNDNNNNNNVPEKSTVRSDLYYTTTTPQLSKGDSF